MTVQVVHRKLGQWSVKLRADAPAGIVSGLEFFGHVAVIPGSVNPVERGDECLTLARYVGVLRDVDTQDVTTLSGVGMAYWLGDENGRGDVIEAPGVTVTGATFPQAVRALLPAHGAITEGTLYTGVAGTLTKTWMYTTPRAALDYVCDTMGGEWRVNGDGTLDAGPASSLFAATPTCVIARKDVAGYDMGLRALPGTVQATKSVKDYTSRVVLVAQALAGGTADAVSNPFKDLHGNPVAVTRVVDETSETTYANAPARAAGLLAQYATVNTSVRLSVDEFDVGGDYVPGDVVWVWDPVGGLVDTANEVPFRGLMLAPVAVRVLSSSWPVAKGYTVGYRDGDGVWTDLTPWVDWESSGGGQVEVADVAAAALSSSVGSSGTQIAGGGGGLGDVAVPGVPVFGAFSTSSYQPDDGLSRAAVTLTWVEPTNTDGSSIVDGDVYEIRYRPSGTTEWDMIAVPFDQLQTTITNLPPACGFDWQIRAVDYATPRNAGAWSATTAFTTAEDVTAPGVPAPPSVAASLIALQLVHTLGLASGGTYNLPLDMDHFEVHVGTVASFVPSASSLVGKLQATGGMVMSGTPAVGTFRVDTIIGAGVVAYVKVIAVDRTGNRSVASSAVSSTASLIDNAHITDLTVSKLTAGTLTAAVILGGSIKTGTTGARVELTAAGLAAYNSAGTKTVDVSAATGSATLTGKLQTGVGVDRIVLDPGGTEITGYTYPAIVFRPATGGVESLGYMGLQSGGVLGMFSRETVADSTNVQSRISLVGDYCAFEQVAVTGGVQRGGGLYLWHDSATLSTTRGDLYISGPAIHVGSTAEDVYSTSISDNSVSGSPVGVDASGRLGYISSSRNTKTGITDFVLDDPASVLDLRPVSYYDRRQVDENGGVTDGLRPSLGFIAEEVDEIQQVRDYLVGRRGDDIVSVHYLSGWAALIPLMREMYSDIQSLKGVA